MCNLELCFLISLSLDRSGSKRLLSQLVGRFNEIIFVKIFCNPAQVRGLWNITILSSCKFCYETLNVDPFNVVSCVTIKNKNQPTNQKTYFHWKPFLSWQKKIDEVFISITFNNMNKYHFFSFFPTKICFHLNSFLSCWVPYFLPLKTTGRK